MDACGVLDARGCRLFNVIGGMDKRLCLTKTTNRARTSLVLFFAKVACMHVLCWYLKQAYANLA